MTRLHIAALLLLSAAGLSAPVSGQPFVRTDLSTAGLAGNPNLTSAWDITDAAHSGQGLRGVLGADQQIEGRGAHPRRVLVRTRPSPLAAGTVNERPFALATHQGRVTEIRSVAGLMLVECDAADRDRLIVSLRADPSVLYAEPDYPVYLAGTPNDTYFAFQWGLQNSGDPVFDQPGVLGADIRAVQAWDLWTGDPSFRVAVVDTGIDFFHPDLTASIWTNPGEIPGNGLDDDGNGYVDDVQGYDVYHDDADPTDFVGHGTHVSGTIAAIGNDGFGVAGVCWQAKIVPIKAFSDFGEGFVSTLIAGVQYALDNNLPLSNNSWGLTDYSQALRDVIAEGDRRGHLFVTAASNFLGRDIDQFPVYPASFDLPNIVVAAATASDDTLSFVTSVGRESVDLGAPGQDILSTFPGGWAFATGSSMSSAFVTGVAALLMSRRPELTAAQVKSRLLDTVREVRALAGRTATGGVLNAAAAVGDCNGNAVADELEIAAGTSDDCDGNGVPDDCQDDCNRNRQYDACELADGSSADCNANGIPDECDVSDGVEADCNGNFVPDTCDVASGSSNDQNDTGVPDECETCADVQACDDANDCTNERCEEGLCYWTDNGFSCDDGNDCTENDVCLGGACSGTLVPSLECAPLLSVTAAAVNGRAIPGGPAESVTVQRGDRLTVEFYIERWWPNILQGMNLYVDTTGFSSGATGRLVPVDDPTPETGAFIDRSREDFIFYDLTTITIVQAAPPDFYQFISVVVQTDDCAGDPGYSAYGGTLLLDISDNAAGTFHLCLDPNYFERSFLIDCPLPVAVAPLDYRCLTINVPLGGCDRSPDCNRNGSWDVCDIAQGGSPDCNRNDVPDECDLEGGASHDCNANGLPDECDVAAGSSGDCDDDLVPDECEPDCNTNGAPDDCDLAAGTPDCNANGVPDECDIAAGASSDCPGSGNGIPDECEADCNGNGTADSCDIARGNSADADDDTIPDDCRVVRRVPGDYATLQTAIDAANPGDWVLVADGWYVGAGFRDIDFLGKILHVRSEDGPDNCVIDGHGVGSVFRFRNGETRLSRLEGFTIINGAIGIQADRGTGPTVRNCILRDHWGAAINLFLADPLIEDCLIDGNEANLTTWNVWSRPVYRRCTLRGNTRGGAIILSESDAEIDNCVIVENESSAGAAIYVSQSKPTIRGTTIVGNRAGAGAAIYADRSIVNVTHSILWDNHTVSLPGSVPRPDRETVYLTQSVLHLSHSAVAGGMDAVRTEGSSLVEWGPGMLTASPVFLHTGSAGRGLIDGDVTLSPRSPCIDGGDPAWIPASEASDIYGDARRIHSAVDIGADEATEFSDCNDNTLPDGRDIAELRSEDCNGNHLPDECDIAAGESSDANGDGEPDECAAPAAVAAGPAQVRFDVAEPFLAVAVRVEGSPLSPRIRCVQGYLQPDGSLGASPAYMTPGAWNAVTWSEGVVAGEAYKVWIQPAESLFLPAGGMAISTPLRGDVNRSGAIGDADMIAIVDAFATDEGEAAVFISADIEPCSADGRINANDVLRLVRILAEGSSSGSCPFPCP